MHRTSWFVLVALALVAFVAWRCADRDAPRPGGGTDDLAAARGGEAPVSVGGRAAGAPGDVDRVGAEPDPAPPRDGPDGRWCVQLTGVDPAVPWSSTLAIVFEGVHEVRGVVDGDGAFRFEPPAAARNPGIQHLRFVAGDPNYRLVRTHGRTDALQEFGRDELEVRRIAELNGRVLGPDGAGVSARVRAFALDDAGPREPLLGRTASGPDGRYTLQVPPATDVLVVADVVQAPLFDAAPTPVWATGPASDLRATASELDLRETDRSAVREDLLPASTAARGVFGVAQVVPDLVLTQAAELTGRAALADGAPLAFAYVTATPAGGAGEPFHGQLFAGTNARVVRGASGRTNAEGRFVLLVAAGARFDVLATTPSPVLVGGAPRASVVAPGHVELTAPGEVVTLRVVDGRNPFPGALVDVDDRVVAVDGEGKLRLTLPDGPVRLQAHLDLLASPPRLLAAGERPAEVTLALEPLDVAEVRLTLRSEPPLLRADFVWQQLPDGRVLRRACRRGAADAPFTMTVPRGRSRLRVVDAHEGFVVPLEVDVDVPAEGLVESYDVRFGGRVRLDVQDARGVRVGGTFTLTTVDGRDVTPATFARDGQGQPHLGAPGELQSSDVNHLSAVLPPGDYRLSVDAGDRGPVERRVTVRALETVVVDIRLP